MRDDDGLWARIAETIRPLKKRHPRQIEVAADTVPRGPRSPKQSRGIDTDTPAPTTPTATPQHPISRGIDGHMRRKLSRGAVTIDDRIDLHGMGKLQAFETLSRFIPSVRSRGARCILVITGKGHENKGMLRMNVPKWLAEPRFDAHILHTCQAHIKDGGAGALYVVLRKF